MIHFVSIETCRHYFFREVADSRCAPATFRRRRTFALADLPPFRFWGVRGVASGVSLHSYF